MPLTLPANLIIEKNKIATPSAWLIMLEIGPTPIRIVRNNEDITYNSNLYTAFPFDLSLSDTSKGELPSLTVSISNVSRIFTQAVEITNGAVGYTVRLLVINSAHLSDLPALDRYFTILSVTCNALVITFKLGAANPMLQRFPVRKIYKDYCSWKFKSLECGYTGSIALCDKSLTTCKSFDSPSGSWSQSRRFGGFPGVSKGGMTYLR